jgi:orotate phosphoribosyltransferase
MDTIAAPAVGGIVLSVLAAAEFHRFGSYEVTAVWADKNGNDFVFERAGFVDHIRGKRVLVVEDLLTTGGSVAKVCRQVEANGGEVVGVSVVVNRGGVTAEDLDVSRLESLANASFEAVDAEQCQLCEQAAPIVEDIGHGAEYKQEHPDYEGGYVKLLTS